MGARHAGPHDFRRREIHGRIFLQGWPACDRQCGGRCVSPGSNAEQTHLTIVDMSKRAFNFCAGPAALPEAVLLRAQAELLDWHGKGLSVMEMSHRSDEFVSIATKAEQDLCVLLDIPSNF